MTYYQRRLSVWKSGLKPTTESIHIVGNLAIIKYQSGVFRQFWIRGAKA